MGGERKNESDEMLGRNWGKKRDKKPFLRHIAGNSYIQQYHDQFDRLLFIMYIVNVLFSAILYLTQIYSLLLKDYL